MLEREPLLLLSKLSVPPWRPHWVRRPRLLLPITQDAGLRLLLCAAPAGFGKTTALIAWADQQRAAGVLVAWYTLDPADNDLARFASYLVGAFAQADPGLPLAELRAKAGADIEQLLVGLLNLLGTLRRPAALVLDDYHLVQAPAVHQALAQLIEHLPTNVQVVLGTRADPPLPLARLRARGQLAELRAADLQFAPAEIAAFFLLRGQPALTPDALALLAAWSEGWAAGLQLVSLALPSSQGDGQTTLEHLHAHVAGSRHHIFTFLADEVFAQQTPEVQAFLLATSIVEDLTPELCDALRKDEGRGMKDESLAEHSASSSLIPHPSSLILAQLEQAHMLLVRLDPTRPWYRYHHLLSDFLRRRLERDRPGFRLELHRRAAGWYAAMGEATRGVNHALAAEDAAYAADLVARMAGPLLFARGEIATLLSWADRFPAPHLAADPSLCLIFGRAAYLAQHAELAERFFSRAEQGLAGKRLQDGQQGGLSARLLVMRAAATSLNGALGQAAVWLANAAALVSPDEPELLATYLSASGVNHMLGGDLRAASAAFAQMGAVARQAKHTYFAADAVGLLALVDLIAGRLAAADGRCATLLASFGDELPALPALGLVLARLGAVAYHRGELERAGELLRRGAQVGRRSLGRADRQLWPWLVRIAVARDDHAGLQALLAEDDGQREAAGDAVIAGLCMAARAEGLLALGAVDEAWHWAERCARLPGEHIRDAEALAMARVLRAYRRPDEALSMLDTLLVALRAGGRGGHLIEGLVVKALALADLQRLPEALETLREAHALGEPEGYMQVFREGGPLLGRTPDAGGSAEPLAEALTEREHEVLRLLARGATNQDIADALVVTVGTVKSHLNHILGKLGARNRTEAVARARALGVLT